MARFSFSNDLAGTQQAISSSFKTLAYLRATTGALRRGKVYDILFGTNGTPADNAMEYDVSRVTAAGTATSATPNALDPADAAADATCEVNATAEPTVTAASSVLFVGVNVRASYRWVAAPGSELVYPATANNGFALRALSPSYTGTATGAILFEEQ